MRCESDVTLDVDENKISRIRTFSTFEPGFKLFPAFDQQFYFIVKVLSEK